MFHVEVRAGVNSVFRISTGPAVTVAGAVPQAAEKADLPEEPINLGPPPAQHAIEEQLDVFLPLTGR